MKSFFCMGKEHCELECGFEEFYLIYVIKGKLEFITENGTWRACSGHVVIINLTNERIQICAGEKCEYYALNIVDTQDAALVSKHLRAMQVPDGTIMTIPAGNQQKNICAVFSKLQKEIVEAAETGGDAVSLLEELMVRIHRASLKMPKGNDDGKLGVVGEIQAYLKQVYDRDITLAELASKYNMSISYLSHVFKETTGMSIMRYLLCYRIATAKECLENSDLPVGDIAEKCGFHNTSNFGRTFKKEVGISPRRYRKSLGNK